MFTASTTELYFPKPHNRVITNTVKFSNSTGVDAVIKMRTTAREKFHVRPRVFSIRSGESVEVFVSSRVLPSDIPEISDKNDECHAVIHQLPSSFNNSVAGTAAATPEALQLAWDAGNHLGRVVLRCHVSEPPPNHKLAFSTPTSNGNSNRLSKSPSMTRNPNSEQEFLNTSQHQQQGGHLRGQSDISVSSRNGKPPLANNSNNGRGISVQNENSAHNNFVRDADVQNYQAALKAGTVSNSSLSGAALERFNEKTQQHEKNLDRDVAQLGALASTAKRASTNVGAMVKKAEEKREEDDAGIIGKNGKVKRVPLSVAVFFMVLAFVAGVLMKQSAFQHHLGM
jgi:hypothetical protein